MLLVVRFAGSGEPGKELVFILRGSRPNLCFTRKLAAVANGLKHARVDAGRPGREPLQ